MNTGNGDRQRKRERLTDTETKTETHNIQPFRQAQPDPKTERGTASQPDRQVTSRYRPSDTRRGRGS